MINLAQLSSPPFAPHPTLVAMSSPSTPSGWSVALPELAKACSPSATLRSHGQAYADYLDAEASVEDAELNVSCTSLALDLIQADISRTLTSGEDVPSYLDAAWREAAAEHDRVNDLLQHARRVLLSARSTLCSGRTRAF